MLTFDHARPSLTQPVEPALDARRQNTDEIESPMIIARVPRDMKLSNAYRKRSLRDGCLIWSSPERSDADVTHPPRSRMSPIEAVMSNRTPKPPIDPSHGSSTNSIVQPSVFSTARLPGITPGFGSHRSLLSAARP